jgi:hypothetical protein
MSLSNKLKGEFWKHFAITFGERCSTDAGFRRARPPHCLLPLQDARRRPELRTRRNFIEGGPFEFWSALHPGAAMISMLA